jgi:hypothetical protein
LFIAIPFAKIYCVEVFSEDRKTPLGVSYRKKFPKLQAVLRQKAPVSVYFAAADRLSASRVGETRRGRR